MTKIVQFPEFEVEYSQEQFDYADAQFAINNYALDTKAEETKKYENS